MAALPVQEAPAVRYLLEFAKFQQENPNLTPNQCAESFLTDSGYKTAFSTPQPGAKPKSSAIQINRNLTTQPIFKPESCPQSRTAPLTGGQHMTRGNSTQTSCVSPQHAFALRAGRSPQQFQYTNPISLSSSYPHHSYTSVAPSLQTLQSLGIDSHSAPALEEYLGQKNRHEPFNGLSRGPGDSHLSFVGAPFKDCQHLTMDPMLDGFEAPQMRHQLSSSAASEYLTSGEDGYLDSPQSFSYPMNRHSRSYSNGSFQSSLFSSSQADSASLTDHLVFGQHSGSYSMSRQASGASYIPNGFAMLRVGSSTGDSISGGMGSSVYANSERDIDGLLNGVGGFASENGDVSSLDKASAQIVLKRSSSVSVDDLKDSVAKGGFGQHLPRPSLSSSPPNSRKQRRIKEEEDGDRTESNIDGLKQQSPEQSIKSEFLTQTDNGPAIRQSEKKNPGGNRHLPTIKPGKNPNNASVGSTKPSYIRPPHPRVYCDKCNTHPEGFRGDHELRRHTDREHAPTKKMYVIKDISKGKILLAKCKACQSGKKYGVDYNATAHLKRQHFKPKVRNGKSKQKVSSTIDQTVPEMSELRKWIEEVEVKVEVKVEVPLDDLYPRRDPKGSEDGTRTLHEGDNGDETSEENEEEETQQVDGKKNRGITYQETARQKVQQQQQNQSEIFQEMDLDIDSENPSQEVLSWPLNTYSSSILNNTTTFTLSNSGMPQQLTQGFDIHVSSTTGSIPLIGSTFNYQQNVGIQVPTQHAHQMLMQETLLLQPSSFTHEHNNAVFSSFLPTASRSAVMFEDTYSFPGIHSDLNKPGHC